VQIDYKGSGDVARLHHRQRQDHAARLTGTKATTSASLDAAIKRARFSRCCRTPTHTEAPEEAIVQVILLEKVVNLGQLGEVVKVKDGFARNFLIPQGKARRATEVGDQGIRRPALGARTGSGREA